MGLIKNDRQLAVTEAKLAGLRKTVEELRTRHRGAALTLYSSGPLGMIEQLRGEIREYRWLRHASPARVMRRYPVVGMDEIGPFLARLRIAVGLTQAELARRVGCRQPDIARLEDAEYQGHTARTLRAITKALGVEIVVGARPLAHPKQVG